LAPPRGHGADSGLAQGDFDDGAVGGNDFGKDFRDDGIRRKRGFDDVVVGEGN
jgi:hypothetical protein